MSDLAEILKQKAALLPDLPGVYHFLDATGKVIYVGKAKSLKRRVASYFVAKGDHTAKVRVMVRKIYDLRHTVVGSESEALLLENNMIKNLQPRYNILLKDDKTFPWIVMRNEHFPRALSTRKVERDGSHYFGPYASGYVQKMVLEMVRGLYQLRTCSLNLAPEAVARGRYKVCLEYHIGNCKGPCEGHQTAEEYAESTRLAEEMLRGETHLTEQFLRQRMEQAATNLRFEEAGAFKKRIEMLENYRSKSVVVSNTQYHFDLFTLLCDEGVAFCNFMRIKAGAVVNSFTVELKLGVEEEQRAILTYAISQIEERISGSLQREVLVPFLPNGELFEQSQFSVPQRGDKLRLMELSERNCRLFRLDKLKQMEIQDPERHTDRILIALQKALHMDCEPRHIECFDNSNLQGTNAVAACVVFRDTKPSRKEYRHFNIKTVVGADDYASMEEIVFRRYSRLLEEDLPLPQLIVVDGGKGQLGVAYRTLKRLGIENSVRIVGLAKRIEEVFFPNDPTPYYIDRNSEALKVLMHIRDEAHRFGITFHRKKRSLAFIKSELEDIPTLGTRSVEKLLSRFRTLSAIRKASPEELAEMIGVRRAQAVMDYFAQQA